MNKLVVSLSPHVHSGDSVQKNMYWVILALVPALICSFISFGMGAIITTAISVAACVLTEWLINKFLLGSNKCTVCDGSAALTGILLAFNMPSNIAPWIVIIGAVFAIGVVKMTFGGLGCNLFNPALAGRAFLLISFPVQMTTWPLPGQGFGAYLDAETGATPLSIMKAAFKSGDVSVLNDLPDAMAMLTGNTGGCLGEVCALALILGLVILLLRKNNPEEQKWKGLASVSGVVNDLTGNPIPFASIVLKGTMTGINSDENGNFTLEGVPADATLVFSSIGYQTLEAAKH